MAAQSQAKVDLFPAISFEEAEALVEALGWESTMREWVLHTGCTLERNKSIYVYGLVLQLWRLLVEEAYPDDWRALSEEVRAWAADFHARAEACEHPDSERLVDCAADVV